MTRTRKEVAVTALRTVLGIVVILQSFLFLYGSDSSRFLARHGLPDVLRLVLGWSEAVGAALFLAPPTVVAGAWVLIVVFCGAIVLHVAHGQFEVGGLLVYTTAAIAVLAHSGSGAKNKNSI